MDPPWNKAERGGREDPTGLPRHEPRRVFRYNTRTFRILVLESFTVEPAYNPGHCPACGRTPGAWRPFLRGNIRPDEIGPEDLCITDHQYGKHWDLVACEDCGFVRAEPMPAADMLASLYRKMADADYELEAEGRKRNFQRILQRLERWAPRRDRLLDVGAATGLLVETAIQRGWDAVGLEPSLSLAARAVAKGLPVEATTLEAWEDRDARFDAVTLIDVIEHVGQPDRFLQAAVRRLRPGGVACIVTPDIRAAAFRLFRHRWWHLRPAHVVFFHRKSLAGLVERSGGKVLAVRRYTWHFTTEYLYSRIFSGKRPGFLPGFARRLCWPLNLLDSLEVYARWENP